MAGVRVGGIGVVNIISPPFAAFDGPATSGDPQVYVASSSAAPGTATKYTDFSGFTLSDENFNPVLSPDGTKVLFEVLSASTGFREIWVTNAVAGSTPTQLVANASQYCFHPAWHPDSDTFVYVLGSGGAIDDGAIYKDTVSSPGSPTLLKSPPGSDGCFRPQFNFDGTRVAYLVNSAPGELRCMDDDGSNDGSVVNLTIYDSNEPPQFSWANTQNLIAYHEGGTPDDPYLIDDTGGGQVQLNVNGDAAGASCVVAGYGYAWPADDSFVVITANTGSWFVFRAELDGSTTTQLGTMAASSNPSYFRGALVYANKIWVISDTDAVGGKGEISYMSLDGTGETVIFDSSAGTGDQLYPFTGGDGWYFN